MPDLDFFLWLFFFEDALLTELDLAGAAATEPPCGAAGATGASAATATPANESRIETTMTRNFFMEADSRFKRPGNATAGLLPWG